jgi:phenylacetate-coenzyme A ligase PaaK-like adenylate-forming protein
VSATSPIRAAAYFTYFRASGRRLGGVYRRFRAEDDARTAAEAVPARLAAILSHARSNVPYYGAALDGLGDRLAADPVGAMAEIPPLTKDIIRERFQDLRSSDLGHRHTYEQTSGGSTGEPVRLIQDMRFRDHDNAVQLLMSSWTGWRPGDPEVVITGNERDILESSIGFSATVANRLMRRRYFNAFRVTEAATRECLELVDAERPKVIRGYAQSLDDIAGFAERESVQVSPQNAIISTAGTLYPFMRQRLESTFGCRVFDQYGSREVSGIAGECGQGGGLHVFPWMNYVEIVDEEGMPVPAGTEGRVLVTSLCNYAMPMIRYEIGDRATLIPEDAPPCPCGRRGQRLAGVAGRTVDTFVALDGSHVNGEYFTHLLYFRDSVRRFQVVQREPDLVVYRLVASSPLAEAERDAISRDTKAAMGAGCKVEFELVEDIAPSGSGKHRYTIREC